MNNIPQRKPNRLKTFSYNQNGAYFITICTKDKKHIFWNKSDNHQSVGASFARPQDKPAITPIDCIPLSAYGIIVDNEIKKIDSIYPDVRIDKYIIMPNHIHMIIIIEKSDGRPQVAPTVSRIIQQFKGSVTKQLGFSPWQKLFYDHIIRNERDYLSIWNYIDTNPARWQDDIYFTEN